MQKSLLKKLIVLLTASALLCVLVFTFLNRKTPDSSSPSATETLNVLNWTSYIPSDLIKDFEKESGIKVNYSTYSSNEELLAKLSSSKEGTYDLIFPSDYMLSLMREKEMLSPLDSTKLSNLSNLDPLFLDQAFDPGNHYSLPFLLATTVFVYDEEKTGPLLSYQNLLSDSLKNNIVLIDDQRIIIGAMLNASGYPMNDTNSAHLDSALAFYNRLRPNIKAFDSDSPKTFFITEEVDAGLIWNAEALLAQETRPGLKISYPLEGFALSMDSYAIPRGSKNTENAYRFIDFLLREDSAERIVAEYPYLSAIESAQNISKPELREIFTRGSYVENVGSELEKLDKLWIKFK